MRGTKIIFLGGVRGKKIIFFGGAEGVPNTRMGPFFTQKRSHEPFRNTVLILALVLVSAAGDGWD